MYSLFFHAVAETILELSKDPAHMGPFVTRAITKNIELKIGLASYSFQHSSRELLEKYLERMETEGNWSVSSRNQRLAAIRRFYRYAAERNPSVMSCYQEMALIPVKKRGRARN